MRHLQGPPECEVQPEGKVEAFLQLKVDIWTRFSFQRSESRRTTNIYSVRLSFIDIYRYNILTRGRDKGLALETIALCISGTSTVH